MAVGPTNGTKTWVAVVQQVGFPIAAFFAMGWAVVTFWLGPQTDLMKALTETTREQAKAYETLHVTVSDTNKLMNDATRMMAGVPAQREQQLQLMKEQAVLLQTVANGIESLKDTKQPN